MRKPKQFPGDMTVTHLMFPHRNKRGEEVDHRTNIWAFGVALYEMLTGELPFKGDYQQTVICSILNEPPEPITSERSEPKPSVENVVLKCLEKDRDERFQNIAELLQGLAEETPPLTNQTLRNFLTTPVKYV